MHRQSAVVQRDVRLPTGASGDISQIGLPVPDKEELVLVSPASHPASFPVLPRSPVPPVVPPTVLQDPIVVPPEEGKPDSKIESEMQVGVTDEETLLKL